LTTDCGPFAIANAYMLLSGRTQGSVLLEQKSLRQHLAQCLNQGIFTDFPTAELQWYKRYLQDQQLRDTQVKTVELSRTMRLNKNRDDKEHMLRDTRADSKNNPKHRHIDKLWRTPKKEKKGVSENTDRRTLRFIRAVEYEPKERSRKEGPKKKDR